MRNLDTVFLGVIPVHFSADGEWSVRTRSPLLAVTIERLIGDLFALGAALENLTHRRIIVRWRFTPLHRSLIGRLLAPRRKPTL